MSRLFISHSSWNNDKAVEIRDWLAKNGWDDVFLDLDPERGIVAGQRWKEALQKAAYRCEVVLALVSKEWLASGWCKSEVDAARLMGKRVIAALVGVDKSAVPVDLTDEQFVDLTGDPQAYRRLKEGLKRAGLDPTTFPFEAGRRPYPGFAYLEEDDAAVFFGRDAQIVRGLDEIRRLAHTGVTRIFVILGASGSGKSSFLRAGLWSRLKRDDLAWLPLPIVRPERAAMSGKYGLAEALFEIISEPRFADGIRQRGLPRSRIDIQDFVENTDDGLAKLLAALRNIAQAGFSGENAAPPTVLLAIDQGEELFNEDGRDEARRFIEILTKTLAADPRTMAILVMRSDAFPLAQGDPALAALPKDTFTLDMMLEGSFRAVIEGPARLVEPPLAIDPRLTDALLEDISGQDALPLLAFTLAHLYDNTRVDNALTLSGYDKIGRVKGVIDQTVRQAFDEAAARGEAPKTKEEQYKLARSAFIPHLAQVNPTGQFVRRVAPRNKIPDEARPLIDRFAEQRLLIRDRRQDAEVIEVAHEALLRQPPFSDWLAEDREFLLWRDRLTQARAAFESDERGLLAGRELAIARSYMQMRAEHDFEPADLAFIRDSVAADDKRRAEEAVEQRKREAAEKEEQERRLRDAERIAQEQTKAAAAQKRFTWAAVVGLVIALGLAAGVLWQWQRSERQRAATEAQNLGLTALEHFDAARGLVGLLTAVQAGRKLRPLLASDQPVVDYPVLIPMLALQVITDNIHEKNRIEQASVRQSNTTLGNNTSESASSLECLVKISRDNQQKLAQISNENLVSLMGHQRSVLARACSPDGKYIVTAGADLTVRQRVAQEDAPAEIIGLHGGVKQILFSADSASFTTINVWNTVVSWQLPTTNVLQHMIPLTTHQSTVQSVRFNRSGSKLVTSTRNGAIQLWTATGHPDVSPIEVGVPIILADFTADEDHIVVVGADGTVRILDLAGHTTQTIAGSESTVIHAALSSDKRRIGLAIAGGSAEIIDLGTAKRNHVGPGHQGWIMGVAFTPDDRLATAGADDTVRFWDLDGRPAGNPIQAGQGQVLGIAVSPRTGLIVTAGDDGTVKLWSAAGEVASELIGHRGKVLGVAFNPDGTIVATSGVDGTFRLWSTSGAELARYPGYFGPLASEVSGADFGTPSVGFSPDGRGVAVPTNGGIVRVWRVQGLDELLRRACDWLERYPIRMNQIETHKPLQCMMIMRSHAIHSVRIPL